VQRPLGAGAPIFVVGLQVHPEVQHRTFFPQVADGVHVRKVGEVAQELRQRLNEFVEVGLGVEHHPIRRQGRQVIRDRVGPFSRLIRWQRIGELIFVKVQQVGTRQRQNGRQIHHVRRKEQVRLKAVVHHRPHLFGKRYTAPLHAPSPEAARHRDGFDLVLAMIDEAIEKTLMRAAVPGLESKNVHRSLVTCGSGTELRGHSVKSPIRHCAPEMRLPQLLSRAAR
jgi:hypothetical protein